jgi:hypothetical protein
VAEDVSVLYNNSYSYATPLRAWINHIKDWRRVKLRSRSSNDATMKRDVAYTFNDTRRPDVRVWEVSDYYTWCTIISRT